MNDIMFDNFENKIPQFTHQHFSHYNLQFNSFKVALYI